MIALVQGCWLEEKVATGAKEVRENENCQVQGQRSENKVRNTHRLRLFFEMNERGEGKTGDST